MSSLQIGLLVGVQEDKSRSAVYLLVGLQTATQHVERLEFLEKSAQITDALPGGKGILFA